MANRPSRLIASARAPSASSNTQQPGAQARTGRRNFLSHHFSRRPPSSAATSSSAHVDQPPTGATWETQEIGGDDVGISDHEADEELHEANAATAASAATRTRASIVGSSLFPAHMKMRQDAVNEAMQMLRADDEDKEYEQSSQASNTRDSRMQEVDGDMGSDLIEMYKNHSRHAVDPAELKAAILESLKKKVNSLDEDRWIYEVETMLDSPNG